MISVKSHMKREAVRSPIHQPICHSSTGVDVLVNRPVFEALGGEEIETDARSPCRGATLEAIVRHHLPLLFGLSDILRAT